jgi:hypothetical protein
LEKVLAELAAACGRCPNTPVVFVKEKGVAGGGAGATAGVCLHALAQAGLAARPETQQRWNVWAHSDVNAACQRPTSSKQAAGVAPAAAAAGLHRHDLDDPWDLSFLPVLIRRSFQS